MVAYALPFSKESSSQISPSLHTKTSLAWQPLLLRNARCLINLSLEGNFLELSYFYGGEDADTIWRLLVRVWTIGTYEINEEVAISPILFPVVVIYYSFVCFLFYLRLDGLKGGYFLKLFVPAANEFDIGTELLIVFGVEIGNPFSTYSLASSS